MGALQFFGPQARIAATELGLDMYRWYFAGRGGVLGDVSSEVVQSAIGYFNPAVIHKMWTTAKERCDVSKAAAAQLGVAYEFGENNLSGVGGLEEATDAIAKLTSSVSIAGLTLFAGYRSMPMPETVPSAFMHQVILLRELRGGVHLAAVTATGCGDRAAHQIHRPNDQELFGYTDLLEILSTQSRAYAKAEPLTDGAMELHAGTWLSAKERDQIVRVIDAAVLAWE